ncbi:hypothetical protein NEPAR06_2113 [Nematocida parisii]|uniref:sn-1-specific diacylglycerol lipase n=1 Tax=Nematocida parisii (strain ERTm3) TaxID=935791 RepID=I3EK24_NEMP3|nr:uncharacterized protein NEPG_00898 [Nematocida parisii ERTm1]EIJ89571.1 hypothetical protein NEQG_00341 [Nematocida parisii ERTm3]KAI5127538.1 hypothetical protein NEPAR03_0984 [Nematocida parisii]EIJ94231.1 hypothetical protein NEPG_00898 [Nematocida parisii ERTm1]KAI5129503.1 hypothetical protein NEPAR08_1653 [Nematocida parisii]KAI5146083.1 hypothetical protein NEPAR07_2093 [Nematocida parisii]|eukprot:XP_013058727.1 hypothetical protein NEPG_00898 [Nematocida parisii ERTm1]
MNIGCKLLSCSTESLIKKDDSMWWWEGAPLFTTGYLIKILYNGKKVKYNIEEATFNLTFECIQDVKMGILEIFIIEEGFLRNQLVGYTFKKVEDLLEKKKNSVHYLKLFPTNDPISSWIYSKQPRRYDFIPKDMEMYLALSVVEIKTIKTLEKKKPSFLWAGFLKNEAIAGRIFDLQEAFQFLFRDMQNISEFVYGMRELFLYYGKMDKLEFKYVPKYKGLEENLGVFDKIKSVFKKRDPVLHRLKYSKQLKEELLQVGNPYKWHVEKQEFYDFHLNMYRYAISPYGHAFLNFHSLINVIDNKIVGCKCIYCKTPKINAEEKFFHLFSGIPYTDIVHEASKYLEHVIFMDKIEGILYITFKGTLHSREALIDIDYKYHKYKNNLFHRGIFKESEKFIKEKEKAIEELMKKYEIKKIRLVGQSLGGALAMLVWMFIRESSLLSKYTTSCIAYSPPPIINNPKWFKTLIGNNPENKITVLIYGNDIVPTLCFGTVFELRLLATHFYAISVSKHKNKEKYIHALLRKLKKKGMEKLYIPGDIYKIRHTTDTPSTFLVRKTHWSEYNAIKLWAKAFIHHTPGAMINSLQKSLKYFYGSGNLDNSEKNGLDNEHIHINK